MEGSYFQQYVVNGGVMMFLLIPCSLLAFGFVIQGFINLRKTKIAPKGLIVSSKSDLVEEDRSRIASEVSEEKNSLARIVSHILSRRAKNRENPSDEDMVSETVEEEIARLYHGNSQLVIIYTISPLLGLLGTILGMMKTFYQFSQNAEQSVALLSKGINEALVTTMWGLGIAIPSFIFLSIFRHRLFKYQSNVLPGAVRNLLRGISEERKES